MNKTMYKLYNRIRLSTGFPRYLPRPDHQKKMIFDEDVRRWNEFKK